jgi:hypothetical protein
MGVAALALVIGVPTLLKAAIFHAATGITSIATMPGGETYIRFTGIPNPGPCGNNNGWVVITPSSNAALKSLAESLYFNRKPVRVDTLGCFGSYEKVVALYSPGG